jgi:selenide,water dikinase
LADFDRRRRKRCRNERLPGAGRNRAPEHRNGANRAFQTIRDGRESIIKATCNRNTIGRPMETSIAVSKSSFRLTDLAHGGGCGCKLAPSVLQQLLAGQPEAGPFARLLVGTETGDDAAVWQIDDRQCVIATTDFFMPMVDDPGDFGRIAAANALSDIYAMGGKPIMALAILGMPLDKLSVETVRAILRGGASICAEAGIAIAGGHSIDSPEPIYGLAVIGLCSPGDIRRNSGARPGDALILTKGVGIGIYSAAFKKRALPDAAYAEMMASTTLLNRIGAKLGQDEAVHAMTDVTGFGLLGHGLELARGGGVSLDIAYERIPFLAQAEALAEAGLATGASGRNWASYGDAVVLPPGLPPWKRTLLTDPQTSGGLLVACAAASAKSIRAAIEAAGYPSARIIGSVAGGEPAIRVG